MNEMKMGSMVLAWIKAARPRTLFASASPVLVGCALAWREGVFQWTPALLCLFVALMAQIASNFANDYFDFKKGADRADRLGPARAVSSGWIKPKAMLRGTLVALALSCIAGCLLIIYGGWLLIPVGIAMALCVLAYSAGPYPLAYNGLGDVCVLLFYGVVPVCFTYYVQANAFSFQSFLLSLAMGFLSVNILVVNNYRDYEQDKLSRKRTTIVLFGKGFGLFVYLLNGLLALLLVSSVVWQHPSLPIVGLFAVFFALFVWVWCRMRQMEGTALNKILGQTSMLVFLFALILTAALVWNGL